MTAQTPDPGPRRRRRAPSRGELAALVVLAVLAFAWGVLWKRSAALDEVASFLPILLLLIGPGVLLGFVGYRLIIGRLFEPLVGYVIGTVVVAAVVGNLVTPALPSSIDVGGRIAGTLDGQALDQAAVCRWGPGRTSVILVTTSLPELIPPPAGSSHGTFSQGLPRGTLEIELPSGAARVADIPAELGPPTMPVRTGTGDVAEGDQAQGAVTLVAGQNAAVSGALHWTCDPAPSS
jgi:hypothetical protein